MISKHTPPRLARRFLRWYCREALLDEVEGDLQELFERRIIEKGLFKARLMYCLNVLMFLHPDYIRKRKKNYTNNTIMFKNYLIIGWRNIARQKMYSSINIGGLALGITIAMAIGLWIQDELTFNHYHQKHERVAAVMQNMTFEQGITTMSSQSYQLGDELRNNYGSYFKRVIMSSFRSDPILTYGDKAISKSGYLMEPGAANMLSLEMIAGKESVDNPNTILVSSSTAQALFGNEDPLGKMIRINNKYDLQVDGVYHDIPHNSSFEDMQFISSLSLVVDNTTGNIGWGNNWLEVYVELADNVSMAQASEAIRDAKLKNVGEDDAKFDPELFLHALSDWRLYSDFENGAVNGGYIDLVWLFAIIGVFVLVLACFNFINLSTARSEKRSKEVGVRKVMGSASKQLVQQFYSETLLVVSAAFLISLLLLQLVLPWFNTISEKQISIQWDNSYLWLSGLCIIVFTTLVSGSYPAIMLSSFSPSKVLKGIRSGGRKGLLPRQALVVLQFTISLILMIGTLLVYQQIQHAKNRPLGYAHDALMFIPIKTKEAKQNFEPFRNELLTNRLVAEVSRSETKVTDMYWSDFDIDWEGRDPAMQVNINRGAVDFEFGRSVGWQIKAGRDFDRKLGSDSSAMVLNESAVKYMNLQEPVGSQVTLYGKDYTVIGVVENLVSQSLYGRVEPTYFVIDRYNRANFIYVRLDKNQSTSASIAKIEQLFKDLNPSTPFEYNFADSYLANKVAFEAQVGKLAGIFALLAILISCMGLFGLSSYMAEQRIREIGIRKVLGASLQDLWALLSKDFVILVGIAILIALPLSFYLMKTWLQEFEYRTELSWSLFVFTAFIALLVTMLTVSFQTVKAALSNPVDSLSSE